MQSVDKAALEKAGEMIAALDHDETGDIHTVTLSVDDRTGDCLVKVESKLTVDILMVIQDE